MPPAIPTDEFPAGHQWRRRPMLSRLLRIAVFVLPVAASLVASITLSRALPRPDDLVRTMAWWVVVLGASSATLIGVARLARRLVPMAALLNLTLLFPDKAPSRFAIARNVGRPEELRQKLLRAQESGRDDEALGARTVLELVAARALHDRHTRGHSERTRIFTDLIAEQLRLSELDRARLRWASLLHDVGKLEVSADILTKPGRPDAHEWEALKAHPALGARLVSPIRAWLGVWALAVDHHHERFDGTGYPIGLRAHEISLGGRIVAVADAYETMTAHRPYKRPVNPVAARQELVRCSGTHFDPDVVRAFLNVSVGRLWHAVGFSAWVGQLPLVGRLSGGLGHIGGHIATTATAATSTAGLMIGGLISGPAHLPAGGASNPHPVSAASGRAGAQPTPGGVAAGSGHVLPARPTGGPSPSPSATGGPLQPSADASPSVATSPAPASPGAPDRTPVAKATPAPSPVFVSSSGAPPSRSAPPAPGDAPPVVTVASGGQLPEGTTMSRTVSFGDSDSSSWTAVVDYGDRAGTETISMSTKSFTLSHAYADEGTYRLTVSVTDDRGASGNASASVTVVDAAPVLSPIPPANLAGTGTKTYTQAGSFTDPSSDSWSATVDYGDGTGVQPLTLSATTFTLTHSYTQGHTFTLTVTVTDDDGSSSGTQTTVKV